MKRIKLLFASLALLLAVGTAVPAAVTFAADPTSAVCDALEAGNDCKDTQNSISINSLLRTIINLLSFVAGVAAVIMIIVSGIKYVTANGDSNKITGAKNTLLYAIIGLVIAVFAQIIVRFVLDNL